MGVKFLSDDHFTAATAALNTNTAFVNSIANIDMSIQFHVTEAPEGEVDFHLTVSDGRATMEGGELDGADVSITTTHETALALFNGDLNTQMAFMTGKIKVAGNMAVLMMNQGVINEWAATIAEVDVEA
jgi:alkyl sulfatase BDS1-like metallo-beta-lactamase superfamily hydrolase